MKTFLLTLLLLFFICVTGRSEDEIVSYRLTMENGLPDNNIRSIYQDELGYLYLKGLHGIYKYDGYLFSETKSSEIGKLLLSQNTVGNRIHDVFYDNLGNRMELKSDGNLLYTDKRTRKSFELHIASPIRYKYSQMKCRVITTKNGQVWISTNCEGIYVYDKNNRRLLRHITKDSPEHIITTNYIVYMMQDRDGNIWASGEYHGLACIQVRPKNYSVINFNTDVDEKSNSVRMLTRLDDGRILISDMYGRLMESTDELKSIKTVYQDKDNFISACLDSRQRLWLGSRMYGQSVDGKMYGDKRTDCIVKDRRGRMWVCGLHLGLKQVNLSGSKYSERSYLQGIGKFEGRVLLMDHRGDLWLGTDKGLFVFNPDQLLANPNRYVKVMDGYVKCLYEDKAGRLWVGVRGKGALYGDNGKSSARHFASLSVADGLVNNYVQFVSEDNHGNICLGTENGCSFYNPATRKIHNLLFHDSGLRNIFSERCVVRLADGRMAFGTSDGIVVTDNLLDIAKKKHPLLVTNFEVNGMPLRDVVDYKGDISQLGRVELDHNQNSIIVRFSNLNYGETRYTTYQCRLDGYDNDWIDLGKDNSVIYKKLTPGSYTLHLRSKEADGTVVEEQCSMQITVNPPVWSTWWAILLYVIVLSLVLFFVYRHQMEMYRLRRHIEVERQLTEYKLKFFTNISHEFRTPLTLIEVAMARIRELPSIPSDMRQPVSNMQRSVERMMRLVNQLLEFRRMQNNKLSLSLQETEIVGFLRNIFMNFYDVAETRHVNYQFATTEKSLSLFVDRGHIDKVVYNLLANAFKYTPKGGAITLRLKTAEGRIVVSVEDTGIGVAKEQQKDLFSRFATGKVKADSIGIGLNLTKELVRVHHGSISYRDNSPQGSIFTVELPLDRSVYQPSDFMKTDNALDVENRMQPETADKANYREMMAQPMNDKTVLIVEDNVQMSEMLSRELGVYFTVKTAGNGDEALALLRDGTSEIDLVVSDVMMPVMNGFELTKAIRGDKQLQHLPVVLLTALDGEDKQERGMDVGADAYVMKPFNLRLLIAQCCSLLTQRARLKIAYAAQPQQKVSAPEVIKEVKDKKFIDRLDMYIHSHIADVNLTVDTMAEHFNMGRTSFYNKVRLLTGLTPNEYLKDLRLRRAAEMLKDEDIYVSEVCYRVGMTNAQYFSTTFKKKYGISPRDYQEGKGTKPNDA